MPNLQQPQMDLAGDRISVWVHGLLPPIPEDICFFPSHARGPGSSMAMMHVPTARLDQNGLILKLR